MATESMLADMSIPVQMWGPVVAVLRMVPERPEPQPTVMVESRVSYC